MGEMRSNSIHLNQVHQYLQFPQYGLIVSVFNDSFKK